MNSHLLHLFEESWSSKLQIQDTKTACPLTYLSKGFFQPTHSKIKKGGENVSSSVKILTLMSAILLTFRNASGLEIVYLVCLFLKKSHKSKTTRSLKTSDNMNGFILL